MVKESVMAEPMREKIPVRVFAEAADASVAIAAEIAALIRARAAAGKPCILGLPTGSTPTGVYAELVRLHRAEGLSFNNVITFNLDEYFPMPREELQSYWRFMHEHLFDHVDIPPAQVHMPDGRIPVEDVAAFCAAYEQAITDAGGLDLQLLGIGRTGHIGFNEPGSGRDSRTRLITLDKMTRMDAASDFFGEEHVPRRAITMGVGTILTARRIILMAWGENKAPIIAQAVEGPISTSVAASFLQEHPNARIVLDAAAAAELTRFKTPWLVESTGQGDKEAGRQGELETRNLKLETRLVWDDFLTRKAVIWLARKVGKAILKLTDEDYNEHGLQDLVAARESAYDVNIAVFRALQETISGWPGGKPASAKRPGDIARPTDAVFPKRVLVFSPTPTTTSSPWAAPSSASPTRATKSTSPTKPSGNIAVFDANAIRFADFAADYNRLFGIGSNAGILPADDPASASNATSKTSSATRNPARSTAPKSSRSKPSSAAARPAPPAVPAASPKTASTSSTSPSTKPAA